MRRLLLSLICVLVLTIGAQAQNSDMPNNIMVRHIWTDHLSVADGQDFDIKNMKPGAEIGYLRNLAKPLNLYVPIKYGIMRLPSERNNREFFGLDAILQLQYYKNSNFIAPYLFAGIGGVLHDKKVDPQIPLGVGFHFPIAKGAAHFNLESGYRVALGDFTPKRNNIQSALGVSWTLDKVKDYEMPMMKDPDMDGDGISDANDACPTVAGPVAFNGCPDTDGDGIIDAEDSCPDKAGLKDLKGCPDSDGDGIADNVDRCPDVAGRAEFNGCPPPDRDKDGIADNEDPCPDAYGTIRGCPDSDGDGIIDRDDRCPQIPGSMAFRGCVDSDKDGVADPDDKCPNEAGPASNSGCPELKVEEKKALADALAGVQFETNSDKIKPASFKILDNVANVAKKYPSYKLMIGGHTDSQGDDAKNLDLSKRRAKACYDYLVKKGVTNPASHDGFGETKPVGDNNTAAGRAKNRRVEFELVPN